MIVILLPATSVKVSVKLSASILGDPETAILLNTFMSVRLAPLPANDIAVNAPVLGLYVSPVSVSAP